MFNYRQHTHLEYISNKARERCQIKGFVLPLTEGFMPQFKLRNKLKLTKQESRNKNNPILPALFSNHIFVISTNSISSTVLCISRQSSSAFAVSIEVRQAIERSTAFLRIRTLSRDGFLPVSDVEMTY